MKKYIVQYRVNGRGLYAYGGDKSPVIFKARSPAGAIAQVVKYLADIDAETLDVIATEQT